MEPNYNPKMGRLFIILLSFTRNYSTALMPSKNHTQQLKHLYTKKPYIVKKFLINVSQQERMD